MINFPQRPIQHEIDSRGVTILQYRLGNEYIFRQITERDYGIDALIELTLNGDVLGKSMSIQIKSTKSVNWNANNQYKMKIDNKTIHYWINGNNPIILFLVDVKEENAYFIDVRKQVRSNYSDYVNNNFSFVFKKSDDLISKNGNIRFLFNSIKEFEYFNYLSAVNEFAVNWKVYFDNILCNQNRDCFLTVEENQLQMTAYIISVLEKIRSYLVIDCEKVNAEEVRKTSKEIYKSYYKEKGDYYEVIEYENSAINCCLESWVRKIVPILKELITIKEEEFWKTNYPITYDNIKNLNLDNWLDY